MYRCAENKLTDLFSAGATGRHSISLAGLSGVRLPVCSSLASPHNPASFDKNFSAHHNAAGCGQVAHLFN
jgi:hypothetical protein